MGGSMSSTSAVELAEQRMHREAEKELRETKARLARQVKVLLLGSSDSGKSTILKQLRLLHGRAPFQPHEIEFYRQLIFQNLIYGLKWVLEAMEDLDISLGEVAKPYAHLIEVAPNIEDGELYPPQYREPLAILWADEGVQRVIEHENGFVLLESLQYFFPQLERLFTPGYSPSELDIVHTRTCTTGVTETVFKLRDHDMLIIDVSGQKSERRKWLHCFQDVTSVLFVVSLSGYDECLVEDKDANRMQDALAVWDSICCSQWFRGTSIILLLNNNDLFEEKIRHSDIKNFFPDFEGAPGDVVAGREYFKKRFARAAQKAGRPKEREVYIHTTSATDTALLKVVMTAVEDTVMRANLNSVPLSPHVGT